MPNIDENIPTGGLPAPTPPTGGLPAGPTPPGTAPIGPVTPEAPANKEMEWGKVDAVIVKAKEAFLAGSSLSDVIDSLIATLTDIKAAETELGGLGEGGLPMVPPEEDQ